MIIAALLAGLTPVQPARKEWLSPEDAPVRLMGSDRVYQVSIALAVRPDGTTDTCTTELGSGDPKIDAYTCLLTVRRLKPEPAVDGAGRKVHGLYRTTFSWWAGGRRPPPIDPRHDYQLKVSSLPRGERSPVAVGIAFEVDASGGFGACGPTRKASPVQLVRAACEEVRRTHKPPPLRSSSGDIVASVQTLVVQFRTD